jgi:hypothetical protein
MSRDDDVKHGEIGDKQRYLNRLKNIPYDLVLFFGVAAFLVFLGFGEFRRQRFLADNAEIRAAELVKSSEAQRQEDKAEQRQDGNGEHVPEKTSRKWKFVISYEESGGSDDDRVSTKHCVPEGVRTAEFPLFVPPLLFGTSGKNFRGGAALVVWFSVHDLPKASLGKSGLRDRPRY